MTGDAPRQGTRLADATGGVTDEVRADAARHYDEEQLPPWCRSSVSNGLGVITRLPGGGYQPGQFG